MNEIIIPQTTGRVGIRLYHPDRDSQGNLHCFFVEVVSPTIQAHTRVYVYRSHDLVALFDELAGEWRGWDGAKEWESLEGELKLSCTTDGKGHVDIAIVVKESHYPESWQVDAIALVEAGQLEDLARAAREFLGNSDPANRLKL